MGFDFAWWTRLTPWMQGLFGGTGAMLLWEGVIKPARTARSLAHVLAEEISHNLQIAAASRLHIKHNPKGIPGDFALSTLVFTAVAERLGELPQFVSEIVLLYRRTDELNKLPGAWAEALREYRALRPLDNEGRNLQQGELDSMLVAYKTGLEVYVNQANALLPKLRRAAVPWYRIDLRVRKPRLKSVQEIDREVAAIVEQRRQGLGELS